jgi:hypothetical protein
MSSVKIIFSEEFLGNLFEDEYFRYIIFYASDGELITIHTEDRDGNLKLIV